MTMTKGDHRMWRAYAILDKDDFRAALQLYQVRTGAKPTRMQISERAPEDLLFMLSEVEGIEVERVKHLMPRDIWLTHEEAPVSVQLNLFERVTHE